ncbi:hypothetical protein F53441_10942 [Fusarium austroafricanum]|uniref:Uncharacterized protein n=1 Tax=Fusarium austroafricanum TaxID=2364996 RepID=A0A8H4NUT4_9HYPO|nr:hypothetical protein F53441_10942 [Fusarium austroafricanum]
MADEAQQPLGARTSQRIHDQIIREVFKLADRDPKNHAKCFETCIKTIEKTKVLEATDYATWESQDLIASSLDEFCNTNRTTKSGNFCMVPITTAVAIAAALNLKHINVDLGSKSLRTNKAFTQSNVWAHLGLAIDVFSQVGECPFFVKEIEEPLQEPTVGRIARGKLAVQTNDSGDTVTPLMILAMARLNGWIKTTPGSWLKKGAVDAPQSLHRRKALNDGRAILEKLGNRKYKQDDNAFIREIKNWLSEPHEKSWLPIIDQAEEDLIEWKFMGKKEAVVASLISDKIDLIQLSKKIQDDESIEDVKKLGQLAYQARDLQNSQRNYIQEAIPSLLELRKTLLEQPNNESAQEVFGAAWNQCFLNQEANGKRKILVGALQRLYDNIAYVVPRSHIIYGAFLELASKVDEVVMACIDLDQVRAKERHRKRLELNNELSHRNRVVLNVAENVAKLDRGSSGEPQLRSKLCSILDSADGLILQANLTS